MAERKENVRNLLESRVLQHGDKPFLFAAEDGRAWTYREFDAAVNRTANMLLAHDIHKGDVVSLLLPNSPEYIIAYFACWKVGAVAGPVNSLLKPEEIEWITGNSESKLLLVGSAIRAEPPASAGGGARRATNLELTSSATPPACAGGSALRFDDVDASTREFRDELGECDIDPDDDAVIIYTSGTTGKPKGCLLTHGNLIANARQIAEWMGFGPDDRLLSVMPLFHMNAVSVTTMSALYAGGSTVITQKFSASRFWDIIEKYQITSFGSVATMLSMLLAKSHESGVISLKQEADSRLTTPDSRLKFAMCGSAPVPSEVLRKFEEAFGVLVIEGYGLSESTCRSTFNPPNATRRPGSCGRPIGNEMKVVDDADNEVPDGELGEIVIRGPNIFKGYFQNETATAEAFRGGWFHTGDIGYRDADGFYYIADRKSDMIIRGGENIYPREIDDVLYRHPAVAAAACVGVPDELYGEEVTAFVVLKAKATADELMTFCRQHLADYKCPKTVHFVADIPKGPTGKLLKRELSKLLEAS